MKRYDHGDITCIEAVRAALSPEEFRGFCKGNVIKYVWRESYKGGDDDLEKAIDYILYAQGLAGDDIEQGNDGTDIDALLDKLDEILGR